MTRSERADSQFLLYRETGSPEALATVFDLCAQELLLLAHHIAAPGVPLAPSYLWSLVVTPASR